MKTRMTSIRAAVFLFGCLAMIGLQGGVTPAQAQDKPNIIVVTGDDIGWANFGVYNRGMMSVRTPNSPLTNSALDERSFV